MSFYAPVYFRERQFQVNSFLVQITKDEVMIKKDFHQAQKASAKYVAGKQSQVLSKRGTDTFATPTNQKKNNLILSKGL